MIKFDTMELTYSIPENKKDITVTQFIKVYNLQKKAQEDEVVVNNDEVLSILLDVPLNYISKLPKTEYDYALNKINDVLETKSTHYQRFKYKGIEFGFIPNLEKITAGEYAALENFLQDTSKHYLDIINVLYRPIKEEKEYSNWWSNKKEKKYIIEEYNNEVDVNFFKDVSCEIYDGAIVFFYNLGRDLLLSTQKYMREVEQKMTEAERSGRSGDGIRHSIRSLNQQILTLTKLIKPLQVRYYLD